MNRGVLFGLGLLALAVVAGLFFALQREDSPTVPPPATTDPTGSRSVELFFPSPDGSLARETREILGGDFVEDDVRSAIAELTAGGAQGLRPIPAGTQLLNVFDDGAGEVTLNFSDHLRTDHPGGSDAEIATLKCIVSTVGLNFPGVDRVRILIDGDVVPTLVGHASLREPLKVDDYRESRRNQ